MKQNETIFENTSCSTDAKQRIKTGFHKVNEQTKHVFIEVEIKRNYMLEM